MRPRPLPVLLLALAAVAAPLAGAHGDAPGLRHLIFTAHDGETADGAVSWFQIDNRTNANPNVTVNPDERVIVHLVNAGNLSHNLRVDPPVNTATPFVEPGNETSISMKVPEDAAGLIPYYDQDHREDGAEGRFRVAGTVDEGGDDPLLDDPVVVALVVGAGVVAAGWWSGRGD